MRWEGAEAERSAGSDVKDPVRDWALGDDHVHATGLAGGVDAEQRLVLTQHGDVLGRAGQRVHEAHPSVVALQNEAAVRIVL